MAATGSHLLPAAADAPITPAHKAAIILATLSPETAKGIVDDISDAQLRAFAKAFSELKSVPPQLLHAIAAEFVAEVERASNALAGGIEEVKRVLEGLAEEDRVNRIIGELHGGGAGSVWSRLESANDNALGEYLAQQRLQIAAIILSKLSFEKTASVLETTDQEFAKRVLLELSRHKPPPDEVIDIIAGVIDKEFLTPLANVPDTGNSGRIVGEIVNFLSSEKRDTLIAYLEETDPEVGKEVRKAVLTFEELHQRLPEAALPALMRALDKDDLLMAIKHGQTSAPETVDFLFANISKRMVEQYKEELSELADPTIKEGEDAQRKFISVVREMVADGDVKLKIIITDEAEETDQ